MSSNPAKHHGKHPLHQHPLLYIAVFLVFALGALLVIVVGNQPDGDDVAAGDTVGESRSIAREDGGGRGSGVRARGGGGGEGGGAGGEELAGEPPAGKGHRDGCAS